jgi:hypothetical protein
MPEKRDKATIGLGTLLFIIFSVLKLAEVKPVADWSWLWIFSPLWIPVALIITLVLIVIVIASIID